MKHPLVRIFAPIAAIVFVGASSVVVAVDEFDVADLRNFENETTERNEADSEALDNVVARQAVPDRSQDSL